MADSRLTRPELARTSIEVILGNQNDSGAYVACPNFAEYRYCWLRDGSFIGYAILGHGRPESTEAFLRWVCRAIDRVSIDWAALRAAAERGEPPAEGAYLPTRFTLSGEVTGDDWPNFQTDGYGHWLWLLEQWLTVLGKDVLPEWAESAVRKTVRYLTTAWRLPSFDAWEEHGDKVHPATLASIYGGLRAAERFGFETAAVREEIRAMALSRLTADGALAKYLGSDAVDASLLWAAVPFGMLAPESDVMSRTAARIDAELTRSGGVVRYADDTYYGGGRWILLTAWLGWYFAGVGEHGRARECANWIELQADESGMLPEQVTDNVNAPQMVEPWVKRWGPVAKPLLWSHAMYLVLVDEIERGNWVDGLTRESGIRSGVAGQ